MDRADRNELPEKYRAVLLLRDVEGLSVKETAQAVGISEANVKVRLLRARLQLREKFREDDDITLGVSFRWGYACSKAPEKNVKRAMATKAKGMLKESANPPASRAPTA